MATSRPRKKNSPPDPETIADLFARFREANPQPTTELEYQSPFQLLIAVILSAQTTDRAVNLATRPLFARAPDARALLALGETELAEAVKTIGLYKTKARHIIATCRQLLELYDGAVPARREQLETLPGVGRKTANVVLNTAFGESTMAVDTHIFRLAHRLGLSQGKTPVAVEQDLLTQVPAAYLKDAHHWLILHGRYVCKARKPECWRCRVNDLCPFPDKTAAVTPVPLDLAPPKAVATKAVATKPTSAARLPRAKS
jgi:endonuclease-3